MPRFDFLSHLSVSKFFTLEEPEFVYSLWMVNLTGLGWGATLLGNHEQLLEYEAGTSKILELGLLSNERPMLELSFADEQELRPYIETWYINDLEEYSGIQLPLEERNVDYRELGRFLEEVVPSYRGKLFDNAFSIGKSRYLIHRENTLATIQDARTGMELYLGSGKASDLKLRLIAALDGRRRKYT